MTTSGGITGGDSNDVDVVVNDDVDGDVDGNIRW